MWTNEERIHWLRQERWIQYPRAERILDRLMELIDYPPHDRMPALVIYVASQAWAKHGLFKSFCETIAPTLTEGSEEPDYQ
jgi:hypothetical protein